jgi:hypothetical protein
VRCVQEIVVVSNIAPRLANFSCKASKRVLILYSSPEFSSCDLEDGLYALNMESCGFVIITRSMKQRDSNAIRETKQNANLDDEQDVIEIFLTSERLLPV